jgi:two-component system LytT family response regulator
MVNKHIVSNKDARRILLLVKKHFSFPKLVVSSINGIHLIDLWEIIYCEAFDNYTVFYLITNVKLTVSKTLKEYESILSKADFVRIHNSYLINLNYVKGYKRGRGGFVIMTNGKQLAVAQSRKQSFIKTLLSKNINPF